jgi:hypothetical protein
MRTAHERAPESTETNDQIRAKVPRAFMAMRWGGAMVDPDLFACVEVRTCRFCGCTDLDCSGCIERTGKPCHWVAGDQCSACLSWQDRIDAYTAATGFPRSLFVAEDGRVVGTWIMGNDYRVKTGYYGGYPAGYLRRIRSLFPDKRRALHLFSGKVDLDALPGDTVDINPFLQPTFVDDAQHLQGVPLADYDMVLADPPYSIEDAERYQTTMVKRNAVMSALAGLSPGAHVVWLDQVLPMYRKNTFSIEAVIGMVKSTNHRFRVVTIFKRLANAVS